MDINRHYDAAHTADVLCQLADVVEHCQLTAADIARLLDERSTAHLNATALSDLHELRSSNANSAQFAAGLRRQAALLRDRYPAATEATARK